MLLVEDDRVREALGLLPLAPEKPLKPSLKKRLGIRWQSFLLDLMLFQRQVERGLRRFYFGREK